MCKLVEVFSTEDVCHEEKETSTHIFVWNIVGGPVVPPLCKTYSEHNSKYEILNTQNHDQVNQEIGSSKQHADNSQYYDKSSFDHHANLQGETRALVSKQLLTAFEENLLCFWKEVLIK